MEKLEWGLDGWMKLKEVAARSNGAVGVSLYDVFVLMEQSDHLPSVSRVRRRCHKVVDFAEYAVCGFCVAISCYVGCEAGGRYGIVVYLLRGWKQALCQGLRMPSPPWGAPPL